MERSQADLKILLQGQPVIHAYLRSPSSPFTVMVNGQTVNGDSHTANYNQATKMLKLSLNRDTP
jgi:hypothetical protein